MDTNKRPFYIWLVVILANVIVYLTIVMIIVRDGHSGASAFLFPVTDSTSRMLLGFSVLISIIPTRLSRLNLKWGNYLGYGLPILMLLYSVWHYNTCNGKFCNLLDIPIGTGALIFALFYTLGRNDKIAQSLLWIEWLILIGSMLLIGYHLNLNTESNAWNSATPVEIGKTCDSLPGGNTSILRQECWIRAMATYPNTEVCAWSKEKYSKIECLHLEEDRYRGNLIYGCEDEDTLVSYKKKDDPIEKARLFQCWDSKAKIYPMLDICGLSYDWNKDKCNTHFKSVSQ